MKKLLFSPALVRQKIKEINSLDFTMLKSKLMNKEEGKGWTAKMCNAVEILYKNFLCLILKYPTKDIVPTKQIDDFWHAHILDTRRYHSDCKKIFGQYIHHYPYFGLRGEDDAKDLQNSFSETKMLWKKEFSEGMSVKGLGAVYGPGGGKCKSSVCGSTCAGRCHSKKMKSAFCSAGGGNCVSTCKGEANCVSTCSGQGGNCVSSCKKERPIKKVA